MFVKGRRPRQIIRSVIKEDAYPEYKLSKEYLVCQLDPIC